ncbi:MAG: hypothetical protein N4A46_08640 [Schleiferiaceae bacterium]|nr:hypothetical protein [Schleiferiaceae bacterium]
MENITTGHWIFAGIFTILFVAILWWTYQKDKGTHKMHYAGAFKIIVFIIVTFFIIFIFKRLG